MPIQENHTEMGKCVLKISVDEYFRLFEEDDGNFSIDKYFIERGDKKVSSSSWEEPSDP